MKPGKFSPGNDKDPNSKPVFHIKFDDETGQFIVHGVKMGLRQQQQNKEVYDELQATAAGFNERMEAYWNAKLEGLKAKHEDELERQKQALEQKTKQLESTKAELASLQSGKDELMSNLMEENAKNVKTEASTSGGSGCSALSVKLRKVSDERDLLTYRHGLVLSFLRELRALHGYEFDESRVEVSALDKDELAEFFKYLKEKAATEQATMDQEKLIGVQLRGKITELEDQINDGNGSKAQVPPSSKDECTKRKRSKGSNSDFSK